MPVAAAQLLRRPVRCAGANRGWRALDSETAGGPVQEEMFCDEFILVDLRVFDNCKRVCEKCDHVFNLAADMGGMGFIQSNHSVIMYNNTMISFNMIEAARQADIKRCVPCCHLSPCSFSCPCGMYMWSSYARGLLHLSQQE